LIPLVLSSIAVKGGRERRWYRKSGQSACYGQSGEEETSHFFLEKKKRIPLRRRRKKKKKSGPPEGHIETGRMMITVSGTKQGQKKNNKTISGDPLLPLIIVSPNNSRVNNKIPPRQN
jgi:hypothetical protein